MWNRLLLHFRSFIENVHVNDIEKVRMNWKIKIRRREQRKQTNFISKVEVKRFKIKIII